MQIDLTAFLLAASRSVDGGGAVVLGHSRRVAFMTRRVCQALGLPTDALDKGFDAALMHDIGIAHENEHWRILDGMDWEGAQAHCDRGADLASSCAALEPFTALVHLHHTAWSYLADDAPDTDETSRLLANCIYMVDRVDVALARGRNLSPAQQRLDIQALLEQEGGRRFASELVNAFWIAADQDEFWFEPDTTPIGLSIEKIMAERPSNAIDLADLTCLSQVLGCVTSLRRWDREGRAQIRAQIARILATEIGLSDEVGAMVEVAALLHDLGNPGRAVPVSILRDPTLGHRPSSTVILSEVPGLQPIDRWAAGGHVDAPMEGRIVAAAEALQCLIDHRPYSLAEAQDTIVEQVHELARHNRFDRQLADAVTKQLDRFWALATSAD